MTYSEVVNRKGALRNKKGESGEGFILLYRCCVDHLSCSGLNLIRLLHRKEG
jgi:hypothetical protein